MARSKQGQRTVLWTVGVVAAVVAGGALSAVYASSGEPSRGEEERVINSDAAAVAAVRDGVTMDEYRAATDRLRSCMGDERDHFSGPEVDLSGHRLVYFLHASTDAEMDAASKVHDACYESILMRIDIDYQLATEESVNQFYSDLRACAASDDNVRHLQLQGPLVGSMLSASDLDALSECRSLVLEQAS